MNHSTEIIVELYRRGNYELLGLFQKQLDALQYLEDQTTNEILYGGAARGGKSVVGCRWQIMRRLAMPGSYSMIARAELKKLSETTLLTYFQTLKEWGLKQGEDYKYNDQKKIIEFSNGSRTFFTEIKYLPSDPEFDRLGSYDLTDAFIDEAQQIHWKAREVLKGRFSVLHGKEIKRKGVTPPMRGSEGRDIPNTKFSNKNDPQKPDGKKYEWQTIPKTLYTCNPAKTWVYGDFVKPAMNGVLSARKKFIVALPSDNPHVPQAFFDNLKTADKVTKQRLLYGNFEYDDDPSALCDYDAICDMFTNTHVVGGEKCISADLAMQGRDRFIAGSWEGLVCTVDIDKPKSSGKSIEQDLKSLKESKGIGGSQIVADSDGLGAYLESYIQGIKTFHGGAAAVHKLEYVNIKSECGFKLAEMINNRKIRVICTKIQEEQIKKEISVCLKRDNLLSDEKKKKLISKDKMKEYLGVSPDYMDMLLMRMLFLIRVHMPFRVRRR